MRCAPDEFTEVHILAFKETLALRKKCRHRLSHLAAKTPLKTQCWNVKSVQPSIHTAEKPEPLWAEDDTASQNSKRPACSNPTKVPRPSLPFQLHPSFTCQSAGPAFVQKQLHRDVSMLFGGSRTPWHQGKLNLEYVVSKLLYHKEHQAL